MNTEWKLVRVEPTDEMEVAAENDYEQTGATFPRWKSAYAAMLAAAPTPPASAQDDAKDWRKAFEADYEAHFGFRPIWDDELLSGKGAYINSSQRNAFSMWQHGCARASAPAAGDALDAARYRWLKERNGGSIGIVAWHRDEDQEMVLVDEHADAAIDAAIAQQSVRKGE